jgi:hypothetical protein
MNPTHQEFFIKLRRLCQEYSATINHFGGGPVSIEVGKERYKFGWIDGNVDQPCFITRLIEERIDEEPKP